MMRLRWNWMREDDIGAILGSNLNYVNTEKSSDVLEYIIDPLINKKKVKMISDTGTRETLLSERDWCKIGTSVLAWSNVVLHSVVVIWSVY